MGQGRGHSRDGHGPAALHYAAVPTGRAPQPGQADGLASGDSVFYCVASHAGEGKHV